MPGKVRKKPRQGRKKPRKGRNEGNDRIAKFAKAALDAFKKDSAATYRKLVKQFAGNTVSVGVFGVGKCTLAPKAGGVEVNPKSLGRSGLRARAGLHPETVAALLDGKMTVLEAYHTGDLVVQTVDSGRLHEAYTAFVQHSDAALRGKNFNAVAREFRAYLGV